MNLFGLLAASADRHPRHGAVYHGADMVLDFAALAERAKRLGAAIGELAGPGARVLIASPNCPEYVELLFACWAAGAVPVPVNAKLHPDEVAAIAADCRPALGFVAPALADSACPQLDWIEIGGGVYRHLLEHSPAVPVAVAADDLAWLFYTSGTTGRSKGAMLSHGNLHAMAIAHRADFEWIEPEHSLIHAAPMSHGSGLMLLPYVARGARQVVPRSGQFDPDEVIGLCGVHPGCGMFLAPTMVRRLRLAATARPPGLRSIVYGGGPMYLDEIRQSLAALGPVFTQLYGQGEAPMTITGLRRGDHDGDDARLLSSVGWPRSGVVVRIAGPDGAELPRGEAGEILVQGAAVMRGYWGDAAATAAALRDGWLWTGDVGVMDEDGLVSLRDRSKDVIISGGSNIYPREIEDVLLSDARVAEASVVGIADPEWGEIAVAFVVAPEGEAPDAESLDALCLARIARFKRPKAYVFVAALPKNAYGKVLKRALIAAYRPG